MNGQHSLGIDLHLDQMLANPPFATSALNKFHHGLLRPRDGEDRPDDRKDGSRN